MLNYIYSVFKRSSTNADSKTSYYWFGQLCILAILSCFLFVCGSLIILEPIFLENGNTIYEVFIGLVGAFVIVYPIFYAFFPGYNYLASVKNYSFVKANVISLIIIFTPLLLLWLIA